MPENKLMIRQKCKMRFAPAVAKVQQLVEDTTADPIIIGIDGRAASGKTTLAYYLRTLFDCNLFHMDDFFLQPEQRTEKRLAEIGGNVDYERFYEEVLLNIMGKRTVSYRSYSCKKQKILEEFLIPYKRLNIIEGSYSLHPYFEHPYHLSIFTDITKELQIERIRSRNGEVALKRFIEEWIPKENLYFENYEINKDCLYIETGRE